MTEWRPHGRFVYAIVMKMHILMPWLEVDQDGKTIEMLPIFPTRKEAMKAWRGLKEKNSPSVMKNYKITQLAGLTISGKEKSE